MKNELLLEALKIQHNKKMGISKNEENYAFTFIYPPSKVLYSLQSDVVRDKKIIEANLYVHIPYCTGKCTYCYFGCYSLSNAPVKKYDYIEALCYEMQLINNRYGKIKLLSVHFGGGTPTTLTSEEIDKVFESIRRNFSISEGVEITFESSPETLTESKLKCIIDNGVNRLNIGVQTFNDRLLKSINRRHDSKKALEGIELAKKLGLTNINIDLMYGLRGQTMEDWIDAIEKVQYAGVQSISAYRLRLHPKGRLRNELKDFNEDRAIKMYITLLDMMEKEGYYQCSSHKFAIKEEMAQTQIVNKRGMGKNTLIPLGMAAYGNIDNVVFWNERTVEKYVKRVLSEELPISVGYIMNETEQMAKVCVLGIHNVNGIDLAKFENKFGINITDVYGEIINKLDGLGLIELSATHLKPSKLGMIFADEIATEFYSVDVKEKLKNDKYGIFFDDILEEFNN